MTIRYAEKKDQPLLESLDRHADSREWENLLACKRVFVVEEEGRVIGWLRYNLFWDNTPFLNMLYLQEEKRRQGRGRQLLEHWETEMRALGYTSVMTSTASDEYAQHFYEKMGYYAAGGFLPPGEPFELLFIKAL